MADDYSPCLAYIEKRWEDLTFSLTKDQHTLIALPHRFVSPSPKDGRYAYNQFYWDTYFTVIGLTASGRVDLARGMVDNLVYLFKKFGIIPMRNQYYSLGISQPPFLTSMALEVFEHTHDKEWLLSVAEVAEEELQTYWLGEEHRVHKGLSRYWDHYVLNETSEFESGWDRTSRFQDRCLDMLPVDLNACLYKYEADLAHIFGLVNDDKKRRRYQRAAAERKSAILSLMRDPVEGFFFDYNYTTDMRSTFYSVAGFFPLWAGMLTTREAVRVYDALKHFEHAGGVANSQLSLLLQPFRQWDYPNGWACMQWIVVKGLINYGYREDAERIAAKWLNLNAHMFDKTGDMWEKYDVVTGYLGKSGRYPTQHGFGWTNAVFVRLCAEFGWM